MIHLKSYLLKGALPLILAATHSQAAVSFDGANGASVASTTSLSWSHTITATTGTILMVAFSYEDASTNLGAVPSQITFGSQNFTPLFTVNANNTGGENLLSMWYLLNPTSGTNTITLTGLTLDTGTNLVRGSSVSFAGVTAAPTLFQTDSNVDSSAPR